MSDFPTQKLDPRFKYCAINFKIVVDFGAASTHGFEDEPTIWSKEESPCL